MKIAIFIPSRIGSTRLPNKALAEINGLPMIAHVLRRAIESGIADIFVATDDIQIKKVVESNGGIAIMTDSNLPSGTDRIYAAMQQITAKFDIIINLQGDMPNINPKIISEVVNVLKENADADISTAVAKITREDEVVNPNIVKVALAINGEKHPKALYFSRQSIPSHAFKAENQEHWQHLGIYGYRREAIEKFVQLSPSYLEKIERLEQLRGLENNMKFRACIVQDVPISIDTFDDLERIRTVALK